MIKFEDASSSQPEYASEVSSFVFGQGNPISNTAPIFQQSQATTCVLTPTTLNMLEQATYSTHITQYSGPSHFQTAPVMSTAGNWQYEPAAKRMCISSPQSSGYAMQPQNLSVSHDEVEKRKIRRERNKIAAAKCRQRRVDLTNELQNETDDLEAEKQKFMEEIKDLQREKEQLEFVLQAHRPMCKMEKIPLADRPMDLKVYPRSRAGSNCSNTSAEAPPYSSREFDLHTPVFSEKTPHSGAKKSAGLFFKEEPIELNTPTWSETPTSQSPLKQSGRNAASSGSSANSDFPQAVAGTSCASEVRKRSSSSSATSESKSPVRTLLSL